MTRSVFSVAFTSTQALPSDPARAILGKQATPQAVAALRAQLGLHKPLVTQYTHWLSHAVRGDFGVSLANRESVSSLLSGRIQNSLALVFLVGVRVLARSVYERRPLAAFLLSSDRARLAALVA